MGNYPTVSALVCVLWGVSEPISQMEAHWIITDTKLHPVAKQMKAPHHPLNQYQKYIRCP